MAVLPFGPVGGEPNLFGYRFDYVIANFDSGLVLFLAMGAMAVYGVVLAGWSSNSNYSLLGGLRAGAQMISYELAMGFSVVGVMLMAGLHEPRRHRRRPAGQLLGLVLASRRSWAASSSSSPASPSSTARPSTWPRPSRRSWPGYLTEYSGMRWGMFYFAEYVNLVVVSAIVSTLYFGGWRAPFTVLDFIPGPIWLFLKISSSSSCTCGCGGPSSATATTS